MLSRHCGSLCIHCHLSEHCYITVSCHPVYISLISKIKLVYYNAHRTPLTPHPSPHAHQPSPHALHPCPSPTPLTPVPHPHPSPPPFTPRTSPHAPHPRPSPPALTPRLSPTPLSPRPSPHAGGQCLGGKLPRPNGKVGGQGNRCFGGWVCNYVVFDLRSIKWNSPLKS